MQRRQLAHRALRQFAFDRSKAVHALRPEPHAERVDQRSEIGIGAVGLDMAADCLPLGQCLDPGGSERGELNAEAGIDQHETLRLA
jgi:hypothetical protein